MLIKYDETYDKYNKNIYDLLSKYVDMRLKEEIKGKVYVSYSHFGHDKKGLPINNIDDIAVNGTIKLYQTGDTVNYESKAIKNPTWLDIAKLANDMIKITGNKHHIFFEGISKNKDKYFFLMGS